MTIPLTAIDPIVDLLTVFAGPYRVLAYKGRTFGRTRSAVVTWLGVAVAFPAWQTFITSMDSHNTAWATVVLASITYVKMMHQWCSTKLRRYRGKPDCRVGRFEPALAILLGLTACGSFFLVGYGCSAAAWRLVKAQENAERTTAGGKTSGAAGCGPSSEGIPTAKVLKPGDELLGRTYSDFNRHRCIQLLVGVEIPRYGDRTLLCDGCAWLWWRCGAAGLCPGR